MDIVLFKQGARAKRLSVGLWVGHIGYCPLTDWHWRVKLARGETGLPNSFITYVANQIGFYPAAAQVDIVVGITFATVVIITIALWIRDQGNSSARP